MMNADAVNVERAVRHRNWMATDAMIYALGVGAANEDPDGSLPYTTELRNQTVLPTFASALVTGRLQDDLGEYDPKLVVHAEEEIEFFHPFPAYGSARIESRITGMYDKGAATLACIESDLFDEVSRTHLARVTSGMFFRGQSGVGTHRGPKRAGWDIPPRHADFSWELATRPEQAFIYRLSGDRNPLHVDPQYAGAAGFDRPILHGLCTYGIAARILFTDVAQGDPSRFRSVGGRMTKPFIAGNPLSVRAWRTGREHFAFIATDSIGDVVIDRGTAWITEHGK